MQSRAVQQPDGSWVLNGEKRYIGNGSTGRRVHDLRPLRGRRQGPPHRADPREGDEGLRGRRALRHHGPAGQRPAPPLLQRRPGAARERARRARRGLPDRDADPQQRAHRARHRLGRGAKKLLDLAIDHVKERRQFGRPLADFELVQDKIGWMVSHLFGLESMCYLTCGLVDAGVADYSLESAICKVAGTEFLWYAANRALQLAGGEGYMKDQPYEKILRDIRIFPIFEGANDVLRAFIALAGMKPVGEKLSGLGRDRAGRPDPLDRRARRLRERPDPARGAPGPDHHGAHGALRATPTRSPSRSRSSRRHREAPARATQGDHRAPAPAEADRRHPRRHLRPGRGALAGHPHLRGPGRRALRPGALHRRHVLHAAPPAG